MTTEELDRLEAIARAATSGPWRWDDDDQMVAVGVESERDVNWDWSGEGPPRAISTTIIETDSGYYPPRDNDRAHIAAFDPPTVLALIALARRAP